MRCLTCIYGALTRLRNWCYDRGLLRTYRAKVFVLSVGNITVGGSGKTPVTDRLMEIFEACGAAVLSRGYRGHYRGTFQKVKPEIPEASRTFGDEPVWLARRHPNIPVFVGRNRVPAAQEILALPGSQKIKILILDDGFQHRRLYRDWNLLVIDATDDPREFQLLPMGRGREGLYSIKRANGIVLTKCNLVEDQHLSLWRNIILQYSRPHIPIWQCEYRPAGNLEYLRGQKVILFSGIARPEHFQELARQTGLVCLEHVAFADHFEFTMKEWNLLQEKAKIQGACAIVVTEKDVVKIQEVMAQNSVSTGVPVLALALKLEFNPGLDSIYEMVRTEIS